MSTRNQKKIVRDEIKKEISDFYKEEFLRHKTRLETQKTFFSDDTYVEIEAVLSKIIDEIDKMSEVENFQELAGHLLERIDVVTSLSHSKVDRAHRVH